MNSSKPCKQTHALLTMAVSCASPWKCLDDAVSLFLPLSKRTILQTCDKPMCVGDTVTVCWGLLVLSGVGLAGEGATALLAALHLNDHTAPVLHDAKLLVLALADCQQIGCLLIVKLKEAAGHDIVVEN